MNVVHNKLTQLISLLKAATNMRTEMITSLINIRNSHKIISVYCSYYNLFTPLPIQATLVAETVKLSACNAGDPGSVPGSGRSPGAGNGNPLQYSCLENSMDGGTLQATVHGVAKSRRRLSDFTSLHFNLVYYPPVLLSQNLDRIKPYCLKAYITSNELTQHLCIHLRTILVGILKIISEIIFCVIWFKLEAFTEKVSPPPLNTRTTSSHRKCSELQTWKTKEAFDTPLTQVTIQFPYPPLVSFWIHIFNTFSITILHITRCVCSQKGQVYI